MITIHKEKLCVTVGTTVFCLDSSRLPVFEDDHIGFYDTLVFVNELPHIKLYDDTRQLVDLYSMSSDSTYQALISWIGKPRLKSFCVTLNNEDKIRNFTNVKKHLARCKYGRVAFDPSRLRRSRSTDSTSSGASAPKKQRLIDSGDGSRTIIYGYEKHTQLFKTGLLIFGSSGVPLVKVGDPITVVLVGCLSVPLDVLNQRYPNAISLLLIIEHRIWLNDLVRQFEAFGRSTKATCYVAYFGGGGVIPDSPYFNIL